MKPTQHHCSPFHWPSAIQTRSTASSRVFLPSRIAPSPFRSTAHARCAHSFIYVYTYIQDLLSPVDLHYCAGDVTRRVCVFISARIQRPAASYGEGRVGSRRNAFRIYAPRGSCAAVRAIDARALRSWIYLSFSFHCV